MTISRKSWENYITTLRDINEEAAVKLVQYLNTHDVFSGTADTINLNKEELKPFIDYAYAIVNRYGEASASLAAEMYDLTAELEGVFLPPAELAPLAEYGDVAKAINGTIKTSSNYEEIAGAATRWVKMAASDTTLHNAQRDGAQFAWVPYGDTCPFCMMLASRGWQYMSKKALKGGHAEHIHSNCDCQYTIRHDSRMTVAGYDPDKYLSMYRNAEGSTPQERINSMRREQYQRDTVARTINVDTPSGNDRIRLRLNYFDKSDPLFYESFSIEEEPGFEDVCGHGNSSHFEVSVNGIKTPMTAEQFADFITKNGDYKGQDLRFVSCSVAEGDNSFAQELSRFLGNTVKGPNMDAYYAPEEGTVFIGSPYTNIGRWRTFKDGEEIE